MNTPIHKILENTNNIYFKREDMIPLSFGGNKARKAKYFFQEVDRLKSDCVVTYGSSSSNHCRVVANMAASRRIPCYIIGPIESSVQTFNSLMMRLFDAKIQNVPVNEVHDTIEKTIEELRKAGKKPFFIEGGGHGFWGTQAYVDCYNEIREFEQQENIHFDYIFFASGTGSTQAGLVCGQLLNGDKRKIIGISIARKNPRGRQIIINSIKSYFEHSKIGISDEAIENATLFLDDFTLQGYSSSNKHIDDIIQDFMRETGIPLDPTYTGKAFAGMLAIIARQQIKDKNILFIHTGGSPLFFDFLIKFRL